MKNWSELIGTVFRQEFSDLAAAEDMIRITIRLSVALVLGGLLGYEREIRHTPAGLRTHMLVALGSALFVIVPLQSGVPLADITRVLQGIVAGIGFLGAGTILKLRDEGEIKGLTTAASVWMTCAVGIAAGMGHQGTAIVSTAFALIILTVVSHFTNGLKRRSGQGKCQPSSDTRQDNGSVGSAVE
jgi:putative Mg2+ transporter-C (MgtC) family protein